MKLACPCPCKVYTSTFCQLRKALRLIWRLVFSESHSTSHYVYFKSRQSNWAGGGKLITSVTARICDNASSCEEATSCRSTSRLSTTFMNRTNQVLGFGNQKQQTDAPRPTRATMFSYMGPLRYCNCAISFHSKEMDYLRAPESPRNITQDMGLTRQKRGSPKPWICKNIPRANSRA